MFTFHNSVSPDLPVICVLLNMEIAEQQPISAGITLQRWPLRTPPTLFTLTDRWLTDQLATPLFVTVCL